MADGGLGKLFFELGVKDNVSVELNRVLKAIQNADGSISKLKISLAEYQKTLSGDDAKKFTDGLGKSINTALDYLGMLQKIERESNKIASLKKLNPGIQTDKLEKAQEQLKRIKTDLLDLQKGKLFGGVDGADLSPYQRALKNTIQDVKDLQSVFNKENSLSAAKNNAARLTNELEKVKGKLEEIRFLQSEGFRKHINTTPLLSGGNTLRGVKTRLEKMLGDDNLLANETKVKALLSDIAYAYTKATNKVREYGREKKKLAEENSIESGANRQKQALNDIALLLQNIERLSKKNIFGVDTSKMDAAKQSIINIANEIQRLSGTKLIDQEFKNLLSELSVVKSNAHDAMKEVSAGIKKTATESNEAETALRRYGEVLSTIQRKNDELSRVSLKADQLGVTTISFSHAFNEMNALLSIMKNATEEEKKSSAFINELTSEYKKLCNSIAITIDEQKKLNSETQRLNNSNAKQADKEIDNIGKRILSINDALSRLKNTRENSLNLGVDVRRIDNEIFSLTQCLRQLESIRDRLRTGDTSALGAYKDIGTGRDVQIANRVAASYEKANKEAQKGIDIERKRQEEIAKTAAKVRSDLVKSFEQANSHAGKLNSTLQDIKSLFLQGGIVFGAQQFAMSIITTGGEMEKQHIALQSILGDMQNANTLFGQVKELALNSPFTFSELNRDVKQLAAYGVEYDQLYDTTKRLADMSSGLGVSFDRIALAFGQVRARGWLDGKELRQISYAGIPLLNKLSEFYSKQEGKKVSTSDVKKRISNREVDFDDVKSIFWQMTDAGGQFYNMQQTLSETLLGRYNKLKDAWEIMLSDFASGKSVVGGTFIFIIDLVTKLVQSLHSLAPVVAAAFSGFALTKFTRAFGGNAGATFLYNKAKISDEIMRRRMAGGKLTKYETENFITNRGRITDADLKTLTRSGQLTKLSTQRLFIEGKITSEQYKQTMEMLKQCGAMTGLTTQAGIYSLSWKRVGLSIKFAGLGLLNIGRSMISMLGGIPGLLLTGITMAVSYFHQRNAEARAAMERTQDELYNRQKQMNEFRLSNDVNSIINTGDLREIDNAIDSYKEKLKELAPYDFDMFVMKSDEKKSHIDRLRYLDETIRKLQVANDSIQRILNQDTHSDLKKWFDDLTVILKSYTPIKNNFISFKPNKLLSDAENNNLKRIAKRDFDAQQKMLDTDTEHIAKMIQNITQNLTDSTGRALPKDAIISAQKQIVESFMAQMDGLTSEQAKDVRMSLYKGLGILDDTLMIEMGQRLSKSINGAMPEVANAIRAGRQIDDASKDKVKKIAQDCLKQMKSEYPTFADNLQKLLDASNFKAVIELVYSSGGFTKFTESEQSLYDQYIPYPQRTGSGKKDKRFLSFINSIGGVGKHSTEKELNDAAYQKLQKLWEVAEAAKVGKYTKKVKEKRMKEYLDQKALTEEILGIKFEPTYNKSNKPYKPGKGDTKEDSELKALQERLSSLKSARQMYQKYKTIMSNKDAEDKTYKLFPEVKDLDLKDYENAVKKLLDGFNVNTTERKKFETSVYREVAEWLFSEKDKKVFDKKAADFMEYMNRLSNQWDLYKSLLEKTGDKNYSQSAFIDSFIVDDKTQELIDEYNRNFKKNFSLNDLMSLTDSDAKENLLGAEYDSWKKITELLRNNYVKALQDGADVIQKMATYEEKIKVINEKYDNQLKNQTDPKVIARIEGVRNKEVGAVKMEQFRNSSDYLNFYGAIMSLGIDKAQTIGNQIRSYLNQSLADGVIDAREYSKEIKLLNEQLDKLTKPKKSYLLNGLRGILIENKRTVADEKNSSGTTSIKKGQEELQRAKEAGDIIGEIKAKKEIEDRKGMLDAATQLYTDASKAEKTLNNFDSVVNAISNNIRGLVDAFNDIKETADLLGVDTETDAWSDASAFFESLQGVNDSFSKMVSSAESGNVGGVLSGVVGIFTSPIKSFARNHDKKLDRQIKLSERQLNELKNLSSNISSVIEKTLGGIYSYSRTKDTSDKLSQIKKDYLYNKNPFTEKSNSRYSKETYDAVVATDRNPSAYADQLALLNAQRDELQKQRNSEAKKKKDDKDKIADYDQQLKEMELQIKTFAQDFLKDIYSIDMKSWASQLTDAVVGAWEKGENAAEAYRKKVKELVKDVTKNIVSQKIMELALQKPLDFLTGVLQKNGKLDEGDMLTFTDMIMDAGEGAVTQLTGIFEGLKKKGLDLRDSAGSSSSNTVKGITEETADIIASYLNSIRLDVSVKREYVKSIADNVASLPQLNIIAQSQLTAINQLVMLAEYRNGKLDDMYSWMKSVTSDTGSKKIRVN